MEYKEYENRDNNPCTCTTTTIKRKLILNWKQVFISEHCGSKNSPCIQSIHREKHCITFTRKKCQRKDEKNKKRRKRKIMLEANFQVSVDKNERNSRTWCVFLHHLPSNQFLLHFNNRYQGSNSAQLLPWQCITKQEEKGVEIMKQRSVWQESNSEWKDSSQESPLFSWMTNSFSRVILSYVLSRTRYWLTASSLLTSI